MTQPWMAEREVSVLLACALIEEQFPELAPARVEAFGVGWDNVAYRVNEAFVFRFPRRQLGAACMEAEIAVLPHVAESLPLPVTNPAFVGRATVDYPWSFAGYRMLAGRTACAAALDDAQRTRLAEPLAHFLACLHAFTAPQIDAWNARPDTLGRLDAHKRVPMARQALERVRQRGLLPDLQPLHAIVDDIARRHGVDQPASGEEASIETEPVVLVHGDLYARHLLVDEDGALGGVIDWGDIHAGRAATDLMIAHSFLPPAAHTVFRTAYGPISEATWRMARFRAVYHTAALATYAHDTEDEALLRESHTAFRYIISKYENQISTKG